MKRFVFVLALGVVASVAMVAGSAVAADMPVKAAPPPAPVTPTYNWTGFYIGANVGYGWGDNSGGNAAALDPATALFLSGGTWFVPGDFDTSFNQDGWLGGLQIGYNWQFSERWVAGVEADIQLADIEGSDTNTIYLDPGFFGNTFPFAVNAGQKTEWFGTVRARTGFLVTPTLLLYGTGGLAYGKTKASASTSIAVPGAFVGIFSALNCSGTAPATNCYEGSDSKTSVGWTAGAGLEYMLLTHLTLKLEYLHVDLGDQTLTLVSPSPPSSSGVAMSYKFDNATFDLVRVGLNYKF